MIFRLPSELLVYQVLALQQELLSKLDQLLAAEDVVSDPLQLLAQEVVEVDAAGLQLLVALKHECAKRAVQLQVNNASESFRHACVDFGLDSFLLGSHPQGQDTFVDSEAP
jgi:ABC-type transporter Mla MlaB component